MNRKPFSLEVETEVLYKSRRRCVLCYVLDNDLTWKKGQLAHIDRNPENVEPDNAAYFCTPHHDEYDSTPSQTKRFTPEELKRHLTDFYKLLEPDDWWRLLRQSTPVANDSKPQKHGVSLEVYDRRLPVYQKTIEFLRLVVKDLNPDFQTVLKFARETEEALFLFDENIASYLDEMAKKALSLHRINFMRKGMEMGRPVENYSELAKQEIDLWTWFTSQYDEIRSRFAPFLRLSS